MRTLGIFSLFLCFVFSFYSCADKTKSAEKSLRIDKAVMRNIILDISKAERMTMEQDLNREEKKAKTEAYKISILKHYNVTQQDYQQDIQIYLENPPLMKKLYE